jgi:hypothetical protein
VSSNPRQVNGGLLLYHRPPRFVADASTITQHIEAFERYSRFPFWKLNTDLGFPRHLAELSFDVIVVHYTIFASGPHDYLLDDRFLAYLDGAGRTYKIAFFQDEHQYCRRRFAFLDRYRFDCVYTCFEPKQFDQTYGRYTGVPKLISHVPAYVDVALVEASKRLHLPDRERAIDVGYRARPMAPYVGRGGLEKVEIGERFAEQARGRGLSLDIAISEQDRLYGEDWYRFMAGCRCFLGTESGASCADLEDEVLEEYERLSADGREVTIEELEGGALGVWDWKVPLRTTSSRHFEAAALRVCQVLYEGRYSGQLRPMQHYIPLRKDFSNFDEVLERLGDESFRREVVENAHRDLITTGDYSYERFFAGFDDVLREAGLRPSERAAERGLVRRAIPRKPVLRWGVRYLSWAWFWLHDNHPMLWRALYVASRPLVFPARAILKLATRGGPAATP